MLVLPLVLSLLSGTPAPAPAAQAPPPRLLVTPLEVRGGVPAGLPDTLTDALAAEARKTGAFQVTTLRELEGVLTQQQRAQVVGCVGSCVVELAPMLNADQMLSGSVGRVGDEYVLNVVRVRVVDAQTLGNGVRRVKAGRETVLLDVLPGLTGEVLGRPLHQDVIAVPSSPAGGPAGGASNSAGAGGGGGTQVARAGPPPVTPARPRRITVAVFPLDQRSKDPALDVLGPGLADMLGTDLAQCSELQVVEREKLRDVLGELKLQQSNAFDPATVQKLGKLLGAQYLVFGSYWTLGSNFRMDVRLVRVDTAGQEARTGVSGKVEDVMDLEKQAVLKLLGDMQANVLPAEKQELERGRAGTLQDVVAYGKALDAMDRGDAPAARAGAQSLLARLPGLAAARELLARTQSPR